MRRACNHQNRRRRIPLAAQPRNPRLQPYLSTSIWNTPIGSGASRTSAGLAPALGNANSWVTVDPIFVGMDTTAPIKTLSTYPHTKNAAGVVSDVSPSYTIPGGTHVYIPADALHDGKFNGIAALLSADDDTVFWQGQPLWSFASGSSDPAYATIGTNPAWAFTQGAGTSDLYGDGAEVGAHGGSRLSALGGVIRAWEWDDTGAIRHALSINLSGYRFLSSNGTGYRWPATHADTGYNTPGAITTNYYGRNTGFDGMVMGSLLALPTTYNFSGVTDPQALRIGHALQDFGAYVADNTKRDVHAFSVEYSIQTAWENQGASFHAQLMDMISALELIDNNDSSHIGGGGTPRVAAVSELVT